MAIYYRQVDDIIIVSGKTYPYKEQIKACGGTFRGGDKVWAVPSNPESLQSIKDLCQRVGGGPVKAKAPTKTKKQSSLEEAVVFSESSAINLDGISISELMRQVQLTIQQNYPRAVWIIGEIQSLSRRHTGTYMQLADMKDGASKSATVTANSTLWRSTMDSLKHKFKGELESLLQEGMKIRALVQVGFYKDRGSVSLNILDIDPSFTKGALALAREQLLKELRSKGLDQKNKRRPLSCFPFKVGLLSAAGSRAESDFSDQLTAYGFPGELIFHSTQMQGDKTIAAVSEGITKLEQAKCDIIVITRGGGSQADLRWFDDRAIALAIANCPIPVLCAIGHHDDVSVAEEVAFQREKTPTAAADFIVAQFALSRERIQRASQGIYGQATHRLQRNMERQVQLQESLKGLALQFFGMMAEHLSDLSSQLQARHHYAVQKLLESLSRLKERLLNFSQRQMNREQQKLMSASYQIQRQFLAISNKKQQQTQTLLHRLQSQAKQTLSNFAERQSELQSFFSSRDPRPWLKEGWTQLSQGQKKIKSIHDIDHKASIQARLLDGKINLRTVQNQEGD